MNKLDHIEADRIFSVKHDSIKDTNIRYSYDDAMNIINKRLDSDMLECVSWGYHLINKTNEKQINKNIIINGMSHLLDYHEDKTMKSTISKVLVQLRNHHNAGTIFDEKAFCRCF